MLNSWFLTHFLLAGRAHSWRLRLQRIAHSFPLPRSDLPSLHTGSKYIIFWTLCIFMYSLFSQNNQAWLERNQEKFGSRQVIQVIVDISFVQWLIIIIKTSILLSTDFISCHKVKFGYVVFTEAETAERLFRQGGVVVRRASGERIQVQHLATGSVFLWLFNNTPFHGRSASRGWMDCLHSSTAANFYASISLPIRF